MLSPFFFVFNGGTPAFIIIFLIAVRYRGVFCGQSYRAESGGMWGHGLSQSAHEPVPENYVQSCGYNRFCAVPPPEEGVHEYPSPCTPTVSSISQPPHAVETDEAGSVTRRLHRKTHPGGKSSQSVNNARRVRAALEGPRMARLGPILEVP